MKEINGAVELMKLGQRLEFGDECVCIVYPDGCSIRLEIGEVDALRVLEMYGRSPCIHGMIEKYENMGRRDLALKLRGQLSADRLETN